MDTSDAVAKDARGNNASKRRKQRFQLALAHRLWDAADIQIGSFNVLTAWSSKRNLCKEKKQTKGKVRKEIRGIQLAGRYPVVSTTVTEARPKRERDCWCVLLLLTAPPSAVASRSAYFGKSKHSTTKRKRDTAPNF